MEERICLRPLFGKQCAEMTYLALQLTKGSALYTLIFVVECICAVNVIHNLQVMDF